MKNFIIALQVSNVRDQAKIVGDFDTIEQAENYMLETAIGRHGLETVVLKRQDCNQWWLWDRETGQGWQPMEIVVVRLAKERKARELEEAQVLMRAARVLEDDHPKESTHDAAWALRHAQARLFRAQAQNRIEQAEVHLLNTVLEAHGNVEWPMVE